MAEFQIRSKKTGNVLSTDDFVKKQQETNPEFTQDDVEPILQQHPDLFEKAPTSFVQKIKNGAQSVVNSIPGVSDIPGLVKSAADTVTDVQRGAQSAAFRPVATIAKLVGKNPATVKIPDTGIRAPDMTGIPVVGQMADLFNRTQGKSLSELSQAPNTTAGKVGSVAGEIAPVLLPGGAVAKIPSMVGRMAAEGGISGLQSYLQTGNMGEAIKGTMFGIAGVPIAQGVSRVASALLNKFGKGAYQSAMHIPQSTTLKEGEDLVGRGIDTLTTISKNGMEAAKKRFGEIVDGMKAASGRAAKQGAVIEPMNSQSALAKLQSQAIYSKEQKSIGDLSKDLMDQYFPGGNPISPIRAEEIKELFNNDLSKFYKMAAKAGVTDGAIADEVKNAFLRGIRDTMGGVLDPKTGQYIGGVINTPVSVGGKLVPYRQAADIAHTDRSIMDLVDNVLRSKRSAAPVTSMIQGAAEGSLLKGQLATPAQMGVLERWVATPGVKSFLGSRMVKDGKALSESKGAGLSSAAAVANTSQSQDNGTTQQVAPSAEDRLLSPYSTGRLK